MHITAHADIDVVAVEQEDRVSVMLELAAPAAPGEDEAPRPPATIEVVLDRSGSMAGEPLEAAKQAIAKLVDRLDPADRLGVLTFDDAVDVVLPAEPIADKAAANRAIAAIAPGGMTNLSGGLLRGLQEAKRGAADRGGATLILLSDGHANVGETNPTTLASLGASARTEHSVTTSTIGVGLGYDETLMSELARGGQGNHEFAEHGDAAAAVLAGEVEGLLSKTVQAASLLVKPAGPVAQVTVWNDLPSQAVEGGIMVELGDLWAGEQRKLVLTFAVPASSALGLAQVATLELRYVALPDFAEQTVSIPVHVNVVPGDQAAGRIPDPRVQTELVFQQAQEAKRRAAEALRAGDLDAAQAAYAAGAHQLDGAPPSPELDQERAILASLADRTAAGEANYAAKLSRADHARKSRRRGRG